MPRRGGAFLTLFLVTAGCSAPKSEAPAAAPAAEAQPPAEPQRYDLKGKVVAVDKAGLAVTVDHEAIAGFMGAMTMSYPVKDAQLLESLAPGQQMTATVVSSGINYWLENVAVVAPPLPAGAAVPGAPGK